MVTVVHLPPQQAPKQLTAHRHSTNLEEHFLAFLNQNNQRGFVGETDEDAQEIKTYQASDISVLLECDEALAIIAQVAIDQEMTVEKFKNFAKYLRTFTSRAMGLGHCRELLARVLGYKSVAGMLGLNKAMKKDMVDLIKVAETASPMLRRNVGIANRQKRRAFMERTPIVNLRDPSSFRLKDIVRSY